MSDYKRPDDHSLRIAAARDVALWEIGDPSWADTLIAAYENPHDEWVYSPVLDRERLTGALCLSRMPL